MLSRGCVLTYTTATSADTATYVDMPYKAIPLCAVVIGLCTAELCCKEINLCGYIREKLLGSPTTPDMHRYCKLVSAILCVVTRSGFLVTVH